MVWIEHNGWSMQVSQETANNPIKLARVLALLQEISEI